MIPVNALIRKTSDFINGISAIFKSLIENALQSEQNLEKLFSVFSVKQIKSVLEYALEDNLMVPLSDNLLIKIRKKTDVINKENGKL